MKSSSLLLSGIVCLLSFSFGAQAQKRKMPPKPSAAQVYDSVEQPAVPLGGTAKYAQFLAGHQQYPPAAMQRGAQGTVQVSFVIEKTGNVGEVKAETPIDAALDAEAIRLIKSGPHWTPAKNRGQVVRQRVTIPISFMLSPGAMVVARPGQEAPITTPAGDIATSSIRTQPEVMAPDRPTQPVGGNQAFFDWIEKNQHYPALARKRKVDGKVMMAFTVESDGSLTDVRVIKHLGSGLDEEALRLIKVAPKWEPAMLSGKPIKQMMVLPVLFQL